MELDTDEFLTTLAAEHSADLTGSRRTVRELPAVVELLASYADRGEVARGGMGSVRRAWDEDLAREVAVKIVAPRLAEEASALQRFVDEARITGQLDHPNIVPVHRLGTLPNGSPCLVMKLVQGSTLKAWLASQPPPPWAPAQLDTMLAVFLKVCDAVAFAHSRGIVHRDLKPENIMVGSFGQVYVMDWGIALQLGREGEDASVHQRSPMGTPVYMAPEQALRLERDIDQRTDVFLLGAVLYEMLTGVAPHRGPNLVAVLYRAITCAVPHPDEVAPERQCPKALARIALKAMSRERGDRYATVQDMRADIERFVRGEERAPTMVFEAGARVITEGERGREAYVIVSGRCVAYKLRAGERVVLREMGPGDVFGETAVFTAQPRSATVEALETLTVKVVTEETLNESVGLDRWMGAFVRTLAQRFREVDERLRIRELDDAQRMSDPGAARPR